MADFLDHEKYFEEVKKKFREELENPEWKEAIEKGKMDHAYTTASPRNVKVKEEKKWEQALLTPEAGLLVGLGIIAVYIFLARRK